MHRAESTPGSAPLRTPDLSAMLRWPNVPACYGWLGLDRRGRWRLRGETLTHAGLVAFLNRQYGCDRQGNHFVQNGPQRVYVELEYTPWVVRLGATGQLETHIGTPVDEIRGAAIDEQGNLLLEIPEGVALLCDHDLAALHGCLQLADGMPADDASVLAAMCAGDGEASALTLCWRGQRLPVRSLRRADVARHYGFVAIPRAGDVEEGR
ncbi:MAG: DUF2946 family protein [Accumulibacter sp.]|jgi:hypothetical protein|uniref:DUF2946 family protein n=1 Tax=Accumulibacter sp. TaxID=2053492 RepID=UPI002FC30470